MYFKIAAICCGVRSDRPPLAGIAWPERLSLSPTARPLLTNEIKSKSVCARNSLRTSLMLVPWQLAQAYEYSCSPVALGGKPGPALILLLPLLIAPLIRNNAATGTTMSDTNPVGVNSGRGAASSSRSSAAASGRRNASKHMPKMITNATSANIGIVTNGIPKRIK